MNKLTKKILIVAASTAILAGPTAALAHGNHHHHHGGGHSHHHGWHHHGWHHWHHGFGPRAVFGIAAATIATAAIVDSSHHNYYRTERDCTPYTTVRTNCWNNYYGERICRHVRVHHLSCD